MLIDIFLKNQKNWHPWKLKKIGKKKYMARFDVFLEFIFLLIILKTFVCINNSRILKVYAQHEECRWRFTSSWTHQQFFHDDQWFLYVDHEHEVPSSDAYHDEHGSSWDVPNLHAILSRLKMMWAVNIYHQWYLFVCSRTNLGSCIDEGWRWLWQSSRPTNKNKITLVKLSRFLSNFYSLLPQSFLQRASLNRHQLFGGQRLSNDDRHPWLQSLQLELCVYHQCWCS